MQAQAGLLEGTSEVQGGRQCGAAVHRGLAANRPRESQHGVARPDAARDRVDHVQPDALLLTGEQHGLPRRLGRGGGQLGRSLALLAPAPLSHARPTRVPNRGAGGMRVPRHAERQRPLHELSCPRKGALLAAP